MTLGRTLVCRSYIPMGRARIIQRVKKRSLLDLLDLQQVDTFFLIPYV